MRTDSVESSEHRTKEPSETNQLTMQTSEWMNPKKFVFSFINIKIDLNNFLRRPITFFLLFCYNSSANASSFSSLTSLFEYCGVRFIVFCEPNICQCTEDDLYEKIKRCDFFLQMHSKCHFWSSKIQKDLNDFRFYRYKMLVQSQLEMNWKQTVKCPDSKTFIKKMCLQKRINYFVTGMN